MEEKYHKGYIFPDEFYKEYTDFKSHKDFIEKAKEEGIEIILNKTEYSSGVSNLPGKVTLKDVDKIVDNFIAKHSKFKSLEEMIVTAKNIYKDPPDLLPRYSIKERVALTGLIAPNDYELECNICRKHITIAKGTIIPRCNCNPLSIYMIRKIIK